MNHSDLTLTSSPSTLRKLYSSEALASALDYHKHGWVSVADNSPEAVVTTAEKFLDFLSGK